MPGSAAGAAKARAARDAKAALRAHTDQQSQQTSTALIVNGADSVETVQTVGTAVASPSQALTSVLVDAAGPEAVGVLVHTMRQAKSAALRFAAACKLLDLGAEQAAQRRKPGNDQDAESMLSKLADALKLRARRADAVTVAAVQQSHQGPDS